MTVPRSSRRNTNLAQSIRKKVATALLFLTVVGAPAVVRADTNETAPTNPNAAMSGLLTVGDLNACYVLSTTNVKCWGYNDKGVVGDGTFDNATTPKDVVGLTGVSSLSAGQGICAVTTTGGLKCWGVARVNGTMNDSSTATDFPGLSSGVASVTVGDSTACAVLTSGALKCWGSNFHGQLGDGTMTDSLTPVQVSGLTSGVASATIGSRHACALTTSGGVQCWGKNYAGQLGNGLFDQATIYQVPQVTGLTSGVVAITAGMEFNCALLSTGAVKCWGRNDSGQLGNGTTTSSNVPVQVTGLTSGVVAISAGDVYVCALMDSGALKCWGRNLSGQLGDGTETDSNVPVDVIGLDAPAKAVAAGGGQTCVLIEVNDVRCVGANYYGGLGNGTEDNSSTYGKVIGLAPAVVPTTAAPTTAAPTTEAPTTAAPNLPATGSDNDVLVVLAFVLLATGLIIVARRRVTYTNS